MKKHTKKDIQIQVLQERVDHIEDAYANLLDYVSEIVSGREFNKYVLDSTDPFNILDVGLTHIKQLLPFEALAFYLIEEKDASFCMARCEPESKSEELRSEVNQCIEDGTFAWALRQNHSIVIPSKLSGLKLILHVLATQARTRGMFVGTIKDGNIKINDPSVTMLSIAVQNLSYSLESVMLYQILRKNSEIRLSSVVETATDGIISIDSQGKIILWNKGAEQIFGYTANEVYGKDVSFILPRRYLAAHRQAINNLLTGTGKLNHKGKALEVSGLRKDGSEFPIELTTAKWETTEEVFFTGIIRDITEKKEAEQAILASKQEIEQKNRELERAIEQLDSKVMERTAALQKANNELKRLDEMKSTFLSTVSHELRTPLTSILGFANIINNRFESLLFPRITSDEPKVQKGIAQVRQNLAIVMEESERLTKLINEVLDLSKMESGKVEWKYELVSLSEIVERSVAAISSLFDRSGLELAKEIEEGLPAVYADRDKLIQVMINLMSNAVKFTSKGTVTCRAVRSGEEIIVSVSDSGIGISEEDQPKVFEKFKQVGDTLTDKPKGTGLGLPISKHIVEHHGGRIWVESESGKGSTFYFTVPVLREYSA
ncbi:MAG: PAS domain S-box protein [Nitrospirae bacterium]|nr:PAS domain S-box protein [Nitrospirota bacterium]